MTEENKEHHKEGEHVTHEHKIHETHHQVHKIKKDNLWKIISGVLLILLIASIFMNSSNNKGEEALSAEEASQKAISYINENLLQAGTTAKIVGTEEANELYKMKMDIGGREFDSYVTKDGKLLFPSVVDMTQEIPAQAEQETQQQEIEKSDKPTAELYVFSYCPAGSATLDTFAEAGKILKNVADVKVKFFSEMHGAHEKQQNIIQDCIQDVAPDKYWDYATLFVERIYNVCGNTRSVECDKNESVKLMKEVGINSVAVLSCVDKKGESLYASDKNDASALRLQYSPSIVINGVYLGNADRSPEGIKQTICGAFNTPPKECSQTLGEAATAGTGNC